MPVTKKSKKLSMDCTMKETDPVLDKWHELVGTDKLKSYLRGSMQVATDKNLKEELQFLQELVSYVRQ